MYKAKDENDVEFSIDKAETQILTARADGKAIPKFFCPCPTCRKPLVPKINGNPQKRSHHFAHYPNNDCTDTWHYEPMSDWHKNWQSLFPLENQEVYMTSQDGEAHRADICIKNLFTNEDTVIEFQHSPISNSAFNERNKFYSACKDRVVWIFDMKDQITLNDDGTYSWNKGTRFEATFSNFINYQNKITVFFEAKKLICGKEYIILAEITNFNNRTHYKFRVNNCYIGYLNFLVDFISPNNIKTLLKPSNPFNSAYWSTIIENTLYSWRELKQKTISYQQSIKFIINKPRFRKRRL